MGRTHPVGKCLKNSTCVLRTVKCAKKKTWECVARNPYVPKSISFKKLNLTGVWNECAGAEKPHPINLAC